MSELPQNVSQSTRRRNPHLYPEGSLRAIWEGATLWKGAPPRKAPKRLRQSTKPLLNKLEQAWLEYLLPQRVKLDGPYAQSIRFNLANGLSYTPDFFDFDWPSYGELNRPTAWEVKGKWFTDDANAKLKMFAHQYPEIRVILVWKDESGQWTTQRILP